MQHTRVSYRQKVRRRRVGLFLRLSSETELWNNLPEEVVMAATLQTSVSKDVLTDTVQTTDTS